MKLIEITDQMYNRMVDLNMSDPFPLLSADLSLPFVYDRHFGVFLVPFGYHQAAASLLLAWHHGCKNGIEVAEKLNLEYSGGTAEYWIQNTPGAAVRSSQGERIHVYSKESLNPEEQRLFQPFCEVRE